MSRTLALFDFDHTLYLKDSLIEFTKFHHGTTKFYSGLLYLFPPLAGLKMGLLNNQKVKLKYFNYFFGNVDYGKFCESAQQFAVAKIESDLNLEIFTKFKSHIDSGDAVCIVTASAAEWIAPWSKQFGVPVIGTRLDVLQNLLTGKFASPNCYGPEKAIRIKQDYNLKDYDRIAVYGSGKGDIEMLQLATV